MITTDDFVPLIGKVVKRLLIVVWPPASEVKMLDVDISVALEVGGLEGVLFHIEIDKADGWTPIISSARFDDVRPWSAFRQRMADWMGGRIAGPFQHEVFDATRDSTFDTIAFREILDIECVTLKSEYNPFAVKVSFPNDYIIVSPISDGATVETAHFNKLDNLELYKALGDFEYVSLANRKP